MKSKWFKKCETCKKFSIRIAPRTVKVLGKEATSKKLICKSCGVMAQKKVEENFKILTN